MLRFFRVNDPYRLIAILVILLLCALPLLFDPPPLTIPDLRNILVGEVISGGQEMYSEVFAPTPPLSALSFGAIDWLFGRSLPARQIIALLLLFFQAAFFAILLISNRAYSDNTYLPGLIFAILCFVSFDFFSVSAELLGSTVMLLALNNLFKEIEFHADKDETILGLGLYTGIASLFVFSYSIFLLSSFLILFIYTRISLRKALLMIFGFILPHGVVILIYFYQGELLLLWRNFYFVNLTWGADMLVSGKTIWLLGALPLVYLVFSFFIVTREARFTKYQSQLFQVMFLLVPFSLATIFFSRELTPHSFIILVPSLTYFFSHYLLLIRRKWLAELSLWIFVGGILTMSHLARHQYIEAINYSKMYLSHSMYMNKVSGKKVMVLGDDLPLYKNNQVGGYFVDWSLSSDMFAGLDRYVHVEKIDELFRKFPPEVIIDEDNLFPSVVSRIPALRSRYKKENNIYFLVKP